MKIKWKALLSAIAIPLATGGLSAWLTRDGMRSFSSLAQPPLSPPGWLFPVAWTVLYVLMGVASYLIWNSGSDKTQDALRLYAIQLGANFLWPIVFFNLRWFLFAFFWLILLWVLVWRTYLRFKAIDSRAGYLLLPYLVWLTFAAYLNLGVYLLNR